MVNQTHQGMAGDPEVVPLGAVPEFTVTTAVVVAPTRSASVTVTVTV